MASRRVFQLTTRTTLRVLNMAPKQATLGYVRPSQTTLGCVVFTLGAASTFTQSFPTLSELFVFVLIGISPLLCSKFFTKPSDSKPAPQQTKLSFAAKSADKPKKLEPKKQEDDEDVKEEEQEQETKPSSQSSLSSASTKENSAPAPGECGRMIYLGLSMADTKDAESKKRGRPSKAPKAPKSPEKKAANGKVKKEVEEEKADDLDEDDDAPVIKRPRKGRAVIEDEDGDDVMADAPPSKAKPKKETKLADAAAPVLSKKKAASPKPADDGDGDGAITESASEAEQEAEESEEEKPEVVAKARKTVQTKLTSKAKDPYPDWKPGEPVPYAALCKTFSLIELTTKRLEIMAHCSLFLRQVLRLTPDDMLPTVLLMINKLAPDYAGIELGIGESLIMKAIGETTGRSLQVIKNDQKEIGDLGLVAVKSRSTQPTMFKPKPLTVQGVHKGLMGIATLTGNGAQGRKVDAIKKLLSAADANGTGKVDITKDKGGPSEAKYLVRFLEGKLRLGLAEKSVLVSLAQAMICHEAEQKGKVPSTTEMEQAEATLKTVYSELPSYDAIIPAMLESGILKLREACKLRPGVPLKPMLAKPTKAITEVLDRFEGQKFTCEYKYDGERAQIHYVAKDSNQTLSAATAGASKAVGDDGVASIFSRNSEDLSKKYPDILAKLHTWVKDDTKSFVLDCETVAWDVVEKKVLPFQQLMTRKKKDVKVEDVKVKVCVFAFDLLYLNGEAVVEKPLRERRELLHKAFTPTEGEFAFATYMDGQELDEIQTFLDESVKASCEGLMVKMLDGTESGYEPSKRSRNWLKVRSYWHALSALIY